MVQTVTSVKFNDFYNEYNRERLLKSITNVNAGNNLIVKTIEELESFEKDNPA